MQKQPGSDLVLADCVSFGPNGSGPRCARIIPPRFWSTLPTRAGSAGLAATIGTDNRHHIIIHRRHRPDDVTGSELNISSSPLHTDLSLLFFLVFFCFVFFPFNQSITSSACICSVWGWRVGCARARARVCVCVCVCVMK